MSNSFERRLREAGSQTLHKQTVAGMQVEVVDVNLVPTVRVAGMGRTASFPLEKIGAYYSDGDKKFRVEATDEELKPGELNDLAIERFLFMEAK